jgi:hypothetical protein
VLDVVDSVAVEPSRPPSVLVEAKSAPKKESPSGQEITSSTARFRRNPVVLDALIHYKRTDAVLDRLCQASHRIAMKGSSMRKRQPGPSTGEGDNA